MRREVWCGKRISYRTEEAAGGYQKKVCGMSCGALLAVESQQSFHGANVKYKMKR
ncbi:MAG: hypothetical protein ACLTSZ_16405 [Lachnospiraceae bacterium]